MRVLTGRAALGTLVIILPYRFRPLWHYLRGRRNGCGIWEVIRFALQPSPKREALKHISISESDNYWRVELSDVERPLFVHKSTPLALLYPVVVEQYWLPSWHRYEEGIGCVRADDVVLDCGAAEGLFALRVAHRCRYVYAAEPLPSYIESMRRTFEGVPNVEVLPVAFSDRSYHGFLAEVGTASRVVNNDNGTPIEVATIDSYTRNIVRPITYLKADVEGHELQLLLGARRLLLKDSPRIVITTYHVHSHAVEIEAFLKSIHADYKIRVKGIAHEAGHPVLLYAWR